MPAGSATPARPVPAATVLLLRDVGDNCGVEVFMVRRNLRTRFMADNYVFPGGKMDAEDASEVPVAGVEVNRGTPPVGGARDESPSLSFYVTAARELFEEAGVMLARGADGTPLRLDEPAVAARFAEHRRRLREGASGLAEILAAERLRLAADELCFLARWITPSAEPKRFDARFFVARCPAGQAPTSDREETVEHAWFSPAAALAAYRERRIKLPPPTLRNLEDLSGVANVAAACAFARARQAMPVLPIMPKALLLAGNRIALLLPWDPLYDQTPGEGRALAPPHPLAVGPTRFVLEGDLWASKYPE